MRKTRKHGGVSVNVVMECVKPYETASKCVTEFLKQYNFERIKTPTDGNCFYHTITKYLELTQGVQPSNKHKLLRKLVVDKMKENIDMIKPFIIINSNDISNAKYLEELDKLYEDGIWDSDTSDLVSQYAAKALNLKLKIYDVKNAIPSKNKIMGINKNGKKRIEKIPGEPRKIISYTFDSDEAVATINMLRIADGHYELLYPSDAPIVRPRRKTSKKSNIINNITNRINAIKLTNKNSKQRNDLITSRMTRSKTKAIARSLTPAKSSSLEKSLGKIASMESKEDKRKNKKIYQNTSFY